MVKPAPDTPRIPESREVASEQAAGKKPGPKVPPEIRINVSWCKGCGLCVDYCNRGVLEMEGVLPHVVNAERCTRCMQCEAICPDFAIEVVDAQPGEASREKAATGQAAAPSAGERRAGGTGGAR